VLRVTTRQSDDGCSLILEGRVKGPWVAELEKAWQAALKSRTDGEVVVVDLSAVSFADWRGRKLLREMRNQGAKLVGGSIFLSKMLEGPAGTGLPYEN
jgi:hypothetical protein